MFQTVWNVDKSTWDNLIAHINVAYSTLNYISPTPLIEFSTEHSNCKLHHYFSEWNFFFFFFQCLYIAPAPHYNVHNE